MLRNLKSELKCFIDFVIYLDLTYSEYNTTFCNISLFNIFNL